MKRFAACVRKMSNWFYVYCYTAPSGKRYVGFTSQEVKKRWTAHIKAANRGSNNPFHRAIRKYGHAAFVRTILDRLRTSEAALKAERLWIRELETFGANGYNATAGGEGAPGREVSEETRERLAAAARARFADPREREKIGAAHLGRKQAPAVVEARAAMHRGRKASLETREKLSAAKRGRIITPEWREKISLANRGRKLSAEHKAKISKARRERCAIVMNPRESALQRKSE